MTACLIKVAHLRFVLGHGFMKERREVRIACSRCQGPHLREDGFNALESAGSQRSS